MADSLAALIAGAKYINPDYDKSYAEQFDENQRNTLAAQLSRQQRDQNEMVQQELQAKLAREAEQRAEYARLAEEMNGGMEQSDLTKALLQLGIKNRDSDAIKSIITPPKQEDPAEKLLNMKLKQALLDKREEGPKPTKADVLVKRTSDGGFDETVATDVEDYNNKIQDGYRKLGDLGMMGEIQYNKWRALAGKRDSAPTSAPGGEDPHAGMKKQVNRVTGETRWVPK